jgi:hypothetical protein
MHVNNYFILYTITGILLISLMSTVGAIASRKLKFNYGMLSPISFIIYTFIGFLIAKDKPMDVVFACNALIGIFDATAGWNLLMKLKANTGGAEEQLVVLTEGQRTILMTVIAGVFGMIGYMIAHNITI